MLFEKCDNVAESGLGLDETSRVVAKGIEESEGLFASGNSIRIVLNGLVVSGVLISKILLGSSFIVLVGDEILLL